LIKPATASPMKIRIMTPDDTDAVAHLIHHSTNHWYLKNLGKPIFTGGPEDCRIFPEIYESLDPGCCLVAEIDGKLAGSCFHHPRPTHVGVGIMNAAAGHSGVGVARALLGAVIDLAEGLPLRLVSSAMNLDSFSLYTRAGFTPQAVYQDMIFPDPASCGPLPLLDGTLRPADHADLDAMVALEMELARIDRRKDCAFFINNQSGIWRTWVHESADGRIRGWLSSADHPGCRMIGPGIARDEATALALILQQVSLPRGGPPVFLVPAAAGGLVRELYRRGARNLELHLSQVRGGMPPASGVVLPSFLPESG
jgi:GNAT superfamily N-acetyltransferase